MAFKHVLLIGALAAGVSACKPAQPGPAQQAEIKAPPPCDCTAASGAMAGAKGASAAKPAAPALAANDAKAAAPAGGALTVDMATAQIGTAPSRTLIGVSGRRTHRVHPVADRWLAGGRDARRPASTRHAYRLSSTGGRAYGPHDGYVARGGGYVSRRYEERGHDAPLAGPPPSVYGQGYGAYAAYGAGHYSHSESYSQQVVQSGYAQGAYAQTGYADGYGQAGYGAQAYSGVRSYNVSQDTRGDAARSRAERRIRCPW